MSPALLVFMLSASTAALAAGDAGFSSDREAAVYILRPLFPIMDCEGMGVVSRGEVDDHFFALFYSVGDRGSFDISRDNLARYLSGSSTEQVSHIFRMMDENRDGRVSTAEFRSFMMRVIDLAASGQTGEVTLADIGREAPRIIRAEDR